MKRCVEGSGGMLLRKDLDPPKLILMQSESSLVPRLPSILVLQFAVSVVNGNEANLMIRGNTPLSEQYVESQMRRGCLSIVLLDHALPCHVRSTRYSQ